MIDEGMSGDETRELITTIIVDENDQLPKFNKAVFHVNVSEDISKIHIRMNDIYLSSLGRSKFKNYFIISFQVSALLYQA